MQRRKFEFHTSFIILLGTIVLLAICLMYYIVRKQDEGLPFAVAIQAENQTVTVELSHDNDEWALYLPSFANAYNAYAIVDDNTKVLLDDISIGDNDNVGWLKEGPHNLKINNESYDINVYKSANVATMFVDLYRGKISDLYQDKDKKTDVSVKLVESNGEVEYSNQKVKINGRGNSTWDCDKKPFNLTFDQDVSLLGMKPTSRWALLANALDQSGLRDVLMKRFSDFLGMSYPIETQYVDLYIDGKYNGLYVLSEKPDVDEDYMARIEYPSRINDPIPFDEVSSVKIEKYPSDNRLGVRVSAENTIDSVRRYIYSDSAKNPLDVESWAKAYLVDEIFANFDAGKASSYLYWNEGEKVYKGPIWDGDLTLGSSDHFPIRADSLRAYAVGLCWKNLMAKEEFVKEVNKIYYDRRTEIEAFLVENIDVIDSNIQIARELDGIRWKNMYASQSTLIDNVIMNAEEIKTYVHNRLAYLDATLNNSKEYVSVVLIIDKMEYDCTVKKGEIFTVPNEVASLYDSNIWLDNKTGEQVDFTVPLKEDVCVINEDDYGLADSFTSRPMWKLHVIVVIAFVVLFAGAVILDKRKNR